ncbi:MAG TPA: VCBS repeat-containing protein, partial [Thermoanaerobaculia bacterium]|nr:VCBS repeat-containing protein [Thermoanaerobaculia bacterium]
MKRLPLVLLLAATAGCSSSSSKPSAPPPAPTASPAATPTPGIRSRIDPTVIQETDTQVIRALPKKDYIKVDDYNVREPVLPSQKIPFFREDENYYYVSESKAIPEEAEAKRQLAEQRAAQGVGPASVSKASAGVTAADFENLDPPRTGARIHLAAVEKTGLPVGGMWRASFTIADMNGDHIPDIVAPPNRMGNGKIRVWIGDGKGGFTSWPVTLHENGKPATRFAFDYGAVAVGDIDGDGEADIAVASHSQGLTVLYGDGQGNFRIGRTGLPGGDFSSQAVTLLDANGDGKLDLVASRDVPGQEQAGVDRQQVRVYLNQGKA